MPAGILKEHGWDATQCTISLHSSCWTCFEI